MKNLSRFLVILIIFFSSESCSIFERFARRGEPVTKDAIPPQNYDPRYVNQISSVPSLPPIPNRPVLDIYRIDVSEPSIVKILLHVVDSTGTYLSGAADSTWKAFWCEIIEEFDNRTYIISRFDLRETTSRETDPHAIALVLDHSGSIGKKRAFVIQDVAQQFINRKSPSDAITIIKYDGKVGTEVPLTSDVGEILAKFQKSGLAGYGGSTAILDGVAEGLAQLQFGTGYQKKTIVVITDGLENSSRTKKTAIVEAARKSNIAVNTVGFGVGIDESFLREIAESTNGKYRQMYQTGEFDDVFKDLYFRLKNYYSLEYFPLHYGFHKVTIKVCLQNDTLVTHATYDNTPEIGKIVLLNVHFDLDKTVIKSEYLPAIDNVYRLLEKYPDLKIEIRGHTDSLNSTGDPNYNPKLSQKRAEAVKKSLTERGIASDRIKTIGFGESRPIDTNATEEGRAKNRRTEFIIVSK